VNYVKLLVVKIFRTSWCQQL